MLIPLNVYTGFANANHLEELTLQLARKIVEIQSNPAYDSGLLKLVTIIEDENNETVDVSCEGLEAGIVNGVLKIKNYFSAYDFPTGSENYPFNRAELVDAFFHCACYQQRQELSIAKNPGDGNLFIQISVTSADTKGRSLSLDVSLSLLDLPVIITNNGDQKISKAKPYLQG